MKTRTFALLSLATCATTVAALPPLGLQELVAEQRLQEIMRTWEGLGRTAKNILVKYDMEATFNNIDGRKKKCLGEQRIARLPGGQFGGIVSHRELLANGQPGEHAERWGISADQFFIDDCATKERIRQKLPAPEDQPSFVDWMLGRRQGESLNLSFISPFGSLLQPIELSKKEFDLCAHCDLNYTYVEVRPKNSRVSSFQFARVVFTNRDWPSLAKNMPRQIYWIEHNKAERIMTITRIAFNTDDLTVDEIEKPKLEAGWKEHSYEATFKAPAKAQKQ